MEAFDPQWDGWYHDCPECGKEIPHYKDYCSTGCANSDFTEKV